MSGNLSITINKTNNIINVKALKNGVLATLSEAEIERSSNLTNWVSTGTTNLIITNPNISGAEFFRAREITTAPPNLISVEPDIYWDYGNFIQVTNANLIDYTGYSSNGFLIVTDATIEFPLLKNTQISSIVYTNGNGQWNYHNNFTIYVVDSNNKRVQVYKGDNKFEDNKTINFPPVTGNRIQIHLEGTRNRANLVIKKVY